MTGTLSKRPLIVRVMLLYGGLGLLQVLVRLLKSWLEARRMWRMLASTPSGNHSEGLFGSLLDMIKNIHRVHDWRIEASGLLPVSKFKSMAFDSSGIGIVVNDPQCVRHFLKDSFNKYTKSDEHLDPFMLYFKEWLGDGIFSIQHGARSPDAGRSWTLQRKIAANIFTRGNFNSLMQEVFQDKSERLCGVLAEYADTSRSLDMQGQFFRFTMDSIMKIFFGEDSDTLAGGTNRYGEAYDVAHHTMFDYSLHSLPFMSLTKLLLPWPFGGHNGLSWKLHAALSPTCRRFRAACRVLDAESRRLVRDCRADPQLQSRRDLLALFVQAEEKERFSPKFLRDVVLSFVIAGRDTTACLLSWLLFELARHPDVQQKLCAEIDERAPKDRNGFSFKNLGHAELPYLQGVIYEALRLWPPVPFDLKVALEDDVFPNGMKVPQHCKVVFLPYSMGRDPSHWPDPLAFRPERWIPFTAPAPHEFPVFQAGPRICLGMDMAIFETKVVICHLLRQFNFELPPGEEEKVTYTMKLTMNIRNNKGGPVEDQSAEQLQMLVKRRQQKQV